MNHKEEMKTNQHYVHFHVILKLRMLIICFTSLFVETVLYNILETLLIHMITCYEADLKEIMVACFKTGMLFVCSATLTHMHFDSELHYGFFTMSRNQDVTSKTDRSVNLWCYIKNWIYHFGWTKTNQKQNLTLFLFRVYYNM